MAQVELIGFTKRRSCVCRPAKTTPSPLPGRCRRKQEPAKRHRLLSSPLFAVRNLVGLAATGRTGSRQLPGTVTRSLQRPVRSCHSGTLLAHVSFGRCDRSPKVWWLPTRREPISPRWVPSLLTAGSGRPERYSPVEVGFSCLCPWNPSCAAQATLPALASSDFP
jgi:hypothetical protein